MLLDVLRRLSSGDLYLSTLDYQTSGELTGDWHHSVSYAALAFSSSVRPLRLEAEDHKVLLDSAAATLHALREKGSRQGVPAVGGSPALRAHRAAFVAASTVAKSCLAALGT